MSGRKHHYLPRFLQRPFAFRQKGKQFYVYAHHRAHGTYPSNVMELGQSLDFYGGPDDSKLDDAITEGERKLALTIHRINGGEEVPQGDMARLVSALSIRTKAMRQAFTDLLPNFLAAGREHLQDGKLLRNQFRESVSDPVKQRHLIDKEIRTTYAGLNREGRGKMKALIGLHWKSKVMAYEEQFVSEAIDLANKLFDRALLEATSIADKAFLSALMRGPETPARAQRFEEEMHFEVLDAGPGENFVLGDCGPVGVFTDGSSRLALGNMSDDVEMDYVFLPVSPTRGVIGRRSSTIQPLGVAALNKIGASLSHEFFISNLPENTGMTELRAAIGTLDPIGTKEEILAVLNGD